MHYTGPMLRACIASTHSADIVRPRVPFECRLLPPRSLTQVFAQSSGCHGYIKALSRVGMNADAKTLPMTNAMSYQAVSHASLGHRIFGHLKYPSTCPMPPNVMACAASTSSFHCLSGGDRAIREALLGVTQESIRTRMMYLERKVCEGCGDEMSDSLKKYAKNNCNIKDNYCSNVEENDVHVAVTIHTLLAQHPRPQTAHSSVHVRSCHVDARGGTFRLRKKAFDMHHTQKRSALQLQNQ
jgi:hypothetical protein